MNNHSEQLIIIDKNKVYTSYYARACKIIPDHKLVAISLGIPENFNGEILRELNPSSGLLYKYKNRIITDDEYREIYYNETLKFLDPLDIYSKVKGKVIICYCGKDKFCHRHLVIEWLKQNLGSEVIGNEI